MADIDRLRYDWRGFVETSGYPLRGEPDTVRHYQPHVEDGFPVVIHAYLDYDERGFLRGALMFFPDGSPIDPVGNVSVIVRPNARRAGVASRLVRIALVEWPEIDLDAQDFTPAGRALQESLRARAARTGGTIDPQA